MISTSVTPVSSQLFSPCTRDDEGCSVARNGVHRVSHWSAAVHIAPAGATSIAAAAVRVGEVNAGLDFSHRVFDEAHGPLAMAALVRRRRLQGFHRGAEREGVEVTVLVPFQSGGGKGSSPGVFFPFARRFLNPEIA